LRAWVSPLQSGMDGHDVTDELELAPSARLTPSAYAPPRRRLTTGSHAEFVGAIVREFRSSLVQLKGASELLARMTSRAAGTARPLDEGVLGDLSTVINRQTARVDWLVRLLEAVDGDSGSRRVEEVHGPTVARQAGTGCDVVLEIPASVERDEDVFTADPERVRLGLEILFEALTPTGGSASARMPVSGFMTIVAPALDLDEQQRRFALRSAFRVLDMEGCQLRVRRSGNETRAEVRLGPRKK
jgi:hypothetical protein